MKYNYITLGNDCSTATALKNAGFRNQSLPFDWVVSDMNKIIECISENFINFHKELKLNLSRTRIIDYYGFEYPHDYPNSSFNLSDLVDIDDVGDGLFHEKIIDDNWEDFIDINIEKYNRRAIRFLDILKSEKDLIVLYRGSINDLINFKNLMKDRFNKDNIKYVVSTCDHSQNDDIITCNTEINGEWNDSEIWKEAIKKVKN